MSYPNNDIIIKWFELLIKQIIFKIDNMEGEERRIYTFKLSSITRSLNIIKKIKFNIKSGDQLIYLKNIGQGTVDRINEILETGTLKEVNCDEISGEYMKYIEELEKVFDIGRTTAYNLYKYHGIKGIDDLKTAVKNGEVQVSKSIQVGLKYVDKIRRNIPRIIIDEIYIFIIREAIKFDPDMFVMICGSYRRENNTSNDIDMIITHPKIITRKQADKSNIKEKFIKILTKKNFIIDNLTATDTPTKFMGICRDPTSKKVIRIDIRFIPEESYYCAILYFTGSRDFNKQMRQTAKDLGFTLNEYFLLNDKNKPIKIKSEKHIFDILGMEYLIPKLRI